MTPSSKSALSRQIADIDTQLPLVKKAIKLLEQVNLKTMQQAQINKSICTLKNEINSLNDRKKTLKLFMGE